MQGAKFPDEVRGSPTLGVPAYFTTLAAAGGFIALRTNGGGSGSCLPFFSPLRMPLSLNF